MPEKIQVTIIGLGLVGASAGMALRRHQERVMVIGNDRNSDLAANARKLGAVDKIERNLPTAVAAADRVILAVPVDEVKDTLEVIADSLKPGCVILDTCEVKVPVLAWARELLPETVHMVGGHPILIAPADSPEDASADLFHGRFFALTPDARTDETAVQLAADLVTAMDARPYFMDAYEHDGLTAATEQAPALMAAALLAVAARADNWRDLRKAAAGQFYSGTLIAPPTGAAVAAAAIANRGPVLHWLDVALAELGALRQRVADGDEAGLAEVVDEALVARAIWLASYTLGRWEEDGPLDNIPTSGSMLRQMLGFGGQRRAPTGKR